MPSSPYAFEVADLLVTASLDAPADGIALLAMEAILPDLNAVLANVDVAQTFWTLAPDHLGVDPPPDGAKEWWLWRAWVLLRGSRGVGPTIADKVLHHKRPWLFPIFDDATREKMGGESAWRVLHNELRQQGPEFLHLEKWFAAEAAEWRGVGLTRLRIHDILHWAAIAHGEAGRKQLARDGRETLARVSDDHGFLASAGLSAR